MINVMLQHYEAQLTQIVIMLFQIHALLVVFTAKLEGHGLDSRWRHWRIFH